MEIIEEKKIAPYYAPASRRVLSGIVDALGFYIISLLLLYVKGIGFSLNLRYLLLLNIIYLIFAIPYHTYMEYKFSQTLGKRLFKLKVELDNGSPCTLEAAIVRNVLRAVDIVPIFYIVGVLFILLTVDKKRIGDILAHTIVVKEG